MTMDIYVTESQWEEFKGLPKTYSRMPHLNATQEEAMDCCAFMGGRLPTDEELDGVFCPLWEWTTKSGVARGSSWGDNPRVSRASYRFGFLPVDRYDNIGFRCVRD